MRRERTSQRSGSSLIEENSQMASRLYGEAAIRVLQNGINLLARDTGEPLKELIDRRPAFEVLEEGANGYTRRPEEPFTTDLSGDAFDGRAITPVEHG